MDKHGYPEMRELNTVSNWRAEDGYVELMKYLKDIWNYADVGYWSETRIGDYLRCEISTGGWSGNEDLVRALQKNTMFWMMCWYMSKRGGHYEFRVRKGT